MFRFFNAISPLLSYQVQRDRVVAPNWMDSARFDVMAKLPPNAIKEEYHLMLQNLLAERFQLKVHREQRRLPVYKVTVAKEGAKLKESTASEPMSINQRVTGGRGKLEAKGATMPAFISGLQGKLNLVLGVEDRADRISDETGLTGRYDFVLEFDVPQRDPATGVMDPGVDFATALRQQLGLVLEKSNAELDVIVVDSAERVPTEN